MALTPCNYHSGARVARRPPSDPEIAAAPPTGSDQDDHSGLTRNIRVSLLYFLSTAHRCLGRVRVYGVPLGSANREMLVDFACAQIATLTCIMGRAHLVLNVGLNTLGASRVPQPYLGSFFYGQG